MSDLQGRRIPGEERSGRGRRPILWIVLALIALALLALLIPFACQALTGGGGEEGSAETTRAEGAGGADTAGDSAADAETTSSEQGGVSGDEATGSEAAGAPGGVSAELAEIGDQRGDGSTVTVPLAAVSGTSGWLAIHEDAGGEPGDVIGVAPLREGESADVEVPLDEPAGSGTLYAMVHTEDPADGTYTFPDGDPPVQDGGEVVVRPFEYMAVSAGNEPLPSSGGISPVLLINAIGAALILGALAARLLWLWSASSGRAPGD